MMTESQWLRLKHPLKWYESLCEVPAYGNPLWLPHPDQAANHWDAAEAWYDRKARLVAVAWCRQISHLMPPAALRTLRAAMDLAERAADWDERATHARVRATGERVLALAEGPFPGAGRRQTRVYKDAVRAVGWLNWRTPDGFGLYEVLENVEGAVRQGAEDQAGLFAELADLCRDVFGNPFRPVAVDLSWLTSTVVALAGGIYADRAFDRMPILADALQDAGCDNADALAHCRGGGPHVRGCWVVDLLLGKG